MGIGTTATVSKDRGQSQKPWAEPRGGESGRGGDVHANGVGLDAELDRGSFDFGLGGEAVDGGTTQWLDNLDSSLSDACSSVRHIDALDQTEHVQPTRERIVAKATEFSRSFQARQDRPMRAFGKSTR